MKYSINARFTLVVLFSFFVGFSQNPSITHDLPQIVPPSPTVAALMKFEEVPVNLYTGIPDVSIPLYKVQTRSKDITLDLALKYHPSSIAVKEAASYAGLGWNLFAGGTISRTVKGLPDDWLDGNRSGIYYPNNNFYYIYNDETGMTNPVSQSTINAFFWEAYEKGKYDSEHDLYQFNFMGNTGRFYIKKEAGQLKVKMLENDNTVKIDFFYEYTNNGSPLAPNIYKPLGFEVYDDKGYKYIFDVKEESLNTNTTQNYLRNNTVEGISSQATEYISAFHLSKIYDPNNQLLVSFKYSDPVVESRTEVTYTENSLPSQTEASITNMLLDPNSNCSQAGNIPGTLLPKRSWTNSSSVTGTRKVDTIDVEGKARIYFEFESGRQDPNLNGTANRLKNMTIKDWNYNPVKKYTFFHSSTINNERMKLTKVTESNFQDTKTQSYELEYDSYALLKHSNQSVGIDHWGYSTISNYLYKKKEAHPDFCTLNVLQKMKLPTGGSIIFDFESNTYSYEQATAITDFDSNADNWIPLHAYHTYTTCPTLSAPGIELFTIDEAQEVTISTFVDLNQFPNNNWKFTLSTSTAPGSPVISCNTGQFECDQNSTITMILQPGTYYVDFESWNIDVYGEPITAHIEVDYKIRNPEAVANQFLYGGGIRIGRIGYFESDVDKNYYNYIDLYPENYPAPAKEKKYNYNFFSDPNKSSGALCFPKPIYQYYKSKSHILPCYLPSTSFTYQVNTTFNNLLPLKTHGADVGYKNVTVSETGNGKTEYTYITPIDYPEDEYEISFPSILPAPNKDYKRGLLQNEKTYSEFGQLLTETINSYEIDEEFKRTGARAIATGDCPYASNYENFHSFESCATGTCSSQWEVNCSPYYTGYATITEYFGWVKLKEKITKNYFYNINNAVSILETKELYQYNASNKKISKQTTYTSDGNGTTEYLENQYFYSSSNSSYTQNRKSEIKRIESRRNNNVISINEIDYSKVWNGFNESYLPSKIKVSKTANAADLEERLVFSRYDQHGNPVELYQKEGKHIVYLWGYNKTLPIAMIENATFSEVAAALGISESSLINITESSIGSINSLRTLLPQAMITTYVHTPLIGVQSVTDPRGYITYYYYDGFGRLKEVKDQEGKLLSEHEYKYRTQN